MEISKSLKTPHGTVVFQGELNQEELDLVLQVGLNALLEQGVIPFQVMDEHDVAQMVPGTETKN